MIGTLVTAVAANRTRLRRARNLRAGSRTQAPVRMRAAGPAPLRWLTAASVLLAAAGAALIVVHARWLAAAGDAPPGDGAARFQSVLPGFAFTVPETPGATVRTRGADTLLIVSGMRAGPVHRIDLCDQLLDRARPGRLLPVRIGWTFADAAKLEAPRNVWLTDAAMPRVTVDGRAGADLRVRWDGEAQWLSAGGPAALRGDGWLTWQGGALRLQRRAGGACPAARELLVAL